MVYFANFDTFNFCLRGCNAGSLDPNNTHGMFNSAFVACFNWPSWTTQGINSGDSSWQSYINQCVSPNVYSLKTSQSNSQITTYLRYQGRPFSINLENGGGLFFSVKFTSPIATSLDTGTINGYENVSLSSRQNYIGISGQVVYPATFTGWRQGSGSGTVITTTLSTNLFFNSNYGGVNFLNINKIVGTVKT